MIKKLAFFLPAFLMLTTAVTSCDSSDDTPVEPVDVTMQITRPAETATATLLSEKLTMRNVTTDRTQEFTSLTGISVLPGLYDINYEAELQLESGAVTTLRAAATSVEVKATGSTISLEGYHNIETDDLIIAEIFFAGTANSSGTIYNGDTYVKLYNNTDHVIYADGLSFFESTFTTTDKYDYTPDIMSQAMAVQTIYTIPGSGTQHPVQPGEYLTLCDQGIDHRTTNPNSFDLSGADFEWYDESSNPKFLDIDSPVPNLTKWFCSSNTFWVPNTTGTKAYGIARIPVDMDSYISNYTYDYSYVIVTASNSYTMNRSTYKLPNEWIVDVVNTSYEAKFAWVISTPALDCGWTWTSTKANDTDRFFHSVRRKVLRINDDGTPVLKDTNNSSNDFNAHVIASEIEAQGTAIDASGTPCTTGRTYDGVTPIQ